MVTIYAFKNIVTGFCYIGCTKHKLGKRFKEHKSLLNHHRHSERLLQQSWDEHGPSKFEIISLEELPTDCSVVDKREAELRWMKHYEVMDLLFNGNRTSFQPTKEASANGQPKATAAVGRKWSAEANEKRRLAQLGKPKNHGEKISATKQALGQKPSLDAARKGGIACTKKRYGKADDIV